MSEKVYAPREPRSAQDFQHYSVRELNDLYIEDGDDWWPLPVSGDETTLAAA